MYRKVFVYRMMPDEVRDITNDVEQFVSSFNEGIVHLFVKGSTAALTMIEYEPNLIKDFFDAMERIAPSDVEYKHHLTWGDDNGKSHVRSSIVGFSISVPVVNGSLWIGRWQQIVLINFDTREREREVMAVFCKTL